MTQEIQSYEAHITIEPVFGERFDQFERCCAPYKFRPAELLMQKQRAVTPERSNKDSFCTGHSKDYKDIYIRTCQLVTDLKESGFDVWRYKIEGIVLDVRTPPLVKIKDDFDMLIEAALQSDFYIDFSANGDKVREEMKGRGAEHIKYNRAVVLHRIREKGKRHSYIRLEDRPNGTLEWSMQTDWSRYHPTKPHLSFKGQDPKEFLMRLPEIVNFVVIDDPA